ncbi:hypothetical protein F4818DRAFT_306567 [Hypoxylon cercidicola]|nr:hypothetical protein F4818DRAFT_306567 [Hypoxylon cercidicola]
MTPSDWMMSRRFGCVTDFEPLELYIYLGLEPCAVSHFYSSYVLISLSVLSLRNYHAIIPKSCDGIQHLFIATLLIITPFGCLPALLYKSTLALLLSSCSIFFFTTTTTQPILSHLRTSNKSHLVVLYIRQHAFDSTTYNKPLHPNIDNVRHSLPRCLDLRGRARRLILRGLLDRRSVSHHQRLWCRLCLEARRLLLWGDM